MPRRFGWFPRKIVEKKKKNPQDSLNNGLWMKHFSEKLACIKILHMAFKGKKVWMESSVVIGANEGKLWKCSCDLIKMWLQITESRKCFHTHLTASCGPPCVLFSGLKWAPALVHPVKRYPKLSKFLKGANGLKLCFTQISTGRSFHEHPLW